jgi:hypothetical protein
MYSLPGSRARQLQALVRWRHLTTLITYLPYLSELGFGESPATLVCRARRPKAPRSFVGMTIMCHVIAR